MAFLEFAHILWEARKPLIVSTDNKSATCFSKRRQYRQHCGTHVIMLCSLIWKNHILPVHSKHFLSRLQLKVTDMIRLNIREYVQTIPLEVTTSSSDVEMKSNFSSHKQTMRISQKNKPFNGQNNLNKMQRYGQKMRIYPPWKQWWKNLQISTETLRRISWMQSRWMHEQE